MVPRREEFILDVRRAARLEQKPTVTTDSELIKADAVAKALHRAAMWLTPKIVEHYDGAEFVGWSADLQEGLHRAIEEFREVAATVSHDTPAANDQFARGIEAFQRLISAVQKVVLFEWVPAAEKLIAQTEAWSAELGWRTRRGKTKLTEMLLGCYSLPQLQFYAEQDLYSLDPVARFVPGAIGAFDLSIQPSYYVTTLYRYYDGDWYVHLDVGQAVKEGRGAAWSKEAFKKIVEELRSLV